ncbi:hypothetical protein [Arthrobacter sp. RT-1]|uniref:hypothetical protein n=1 Tax=Arthrobacter sp. RT-1 TaxID=2292263 RepID=UPI0011C02DE5|nr:hypothetical protein [Arthrobacter sp. RT-1]
MSALTTFTEVHCGTPMELATPAIGQVGAGYSFPPDNAVLIELPPVWRCRCGFQLDAWLPADSADEAAVLAEACAPPRHP